MKPIKHGTHAGYSAEYSRGLDICPRCRKAYAKYLKDRPSVMAARGLFCGVEECGKPQACKGYCGGHYDRLKKYGDPLGKAAPRSPKEPDHGTARGAKLENKRGLPVCGPCREAKRKADREWAREQFAPPPSEYAKRQLRAKYRQMEILRLLRDHYRREYDALLATEKESRPELTFGAHALRAMTELKRQHPRKFKQYNRRPHE